MNPIYLCDYGCTHVLKPINKQMAFKHILIKSSLFSRHQFLGMNSVGINFFLKTKFLSTELAFELSWAQLKWHTKSIRLLLVIRSTKAKRSKANVCFAIYLSICIRFTDVWMRRSSSTSSFYYVQHVVIMIIVGVYVVLWSTIAANANFEPLSCTVSCILNKWHDTYHWSHLNKGKVYCGCVYYCLLWLWLLHRHILVNAFAMKWTKQK